MRNHPFLSILTLVIACSLVRAQQPASDEVLSDIAALPGLASAEPAGDATPTVAGWTFEAVGYAQDVGRKRVVRIGPEGAAELVAPERGEGVVLRGDADTARGDLVSAPFAIRPYRWTSIEVEYRVVSGRPLVFVGLRPTADRAAVDLEFLPNRTSSTFRRERVRLHSGGDEGPYALVVSVGGVGAVQVRSVVGTEAGDFRRPERPICVLDIRSADPELGPNRNFARVASVFGFPSVEYLHYTEFTPEKLAAIDPALLVLPGLSSTRGMVAEQVDASVLAAVEHGVPVVGVCLGHQVLARAQGARLGRSSEWGPTEIKLVRRDPLFDGLPRRSRFFASQSHNYGIRDVVGGLEVIASSADCEIQVARYRGKPWYTFQGHIERGWEVASPEAVLLWKNMLRGWGLLRA